MDDGAGGAQPVAVGAGLDDLGSEGAVDDRGDEARVSVTRYRYRGAATSPCRGAGRPRRSRSHKAWARGEPDAVEAARPVRGAGQGDVPAERSAPRPGPTPRRQPLSDKVRRRVQQETLLHRGRKGDPLYRIRKLLLTGTERLDDRGRRRMLLGLRIGDPRDEVLGAWLAKESVRDVYLTDEPAEAATLVDKAIAGCGADDVEEIRSLGRTLAARRTEILAHHDTGASNGPTEGLNLCVKRVKRCGFGLRRFEHCVLLRAGGVTWPRRPSPPRIRTRSPHSNA